LKKSEKTISHRIANLIKAQLMKPNRYLQLQLLTFALALFHWNGFGQTLPFSLALKPVSISGLSGVQSFAYGQHNGKWLIVGGRTDGLHKSMGMGMMGTPFPSSANNNSFIVIDPLTEQQWTASITSLPTDIKEQLGSTNTEYFQDGDNLYVLGGYGYKSAASSHKTFDKLTAINVPNTINAIINGASFSSYIRQITDPQFQVTGGQLEKIFDTYYLVGGHNFDGTYHSMGGMGMFTQTYTNQLRKFKIADNGTTISITHLPSITDTASFHRRDYNLVQQILPNGHEGLTLFSGVFQTNADIPYLNCVNIDSNGYALNNSFTQYYNHYQCANAPLYSLSRNEMYSIFFGGIAQYYDSSGVMVQDNNAPFVKTIACVVRDHSENMQEYKLPVEMPSLLGAGSEFIPTATLSYYANSVLKLDELAQDTTVIGYIFGGISSIAKNVFSGGMMGGNGTVASNTLFSVSIVKPKTTTSILESTANAFQLQVYPNPSKGKVNVLFHLAATALVNISLTNSNGQVIWNEQFTDLSEGSNNVVIGNDVPFTAGNYFVHVTSSGKTVSQQLVIH
jgi:hypothetical protein